MTKSWFSITASAVPEISIFDEVGAYGITAAIFAQDLKAHGNARNLVLRINSPGGDVFTGQAIFAMLDRHPAKITVLIDGLAASAASMIAMVGDEIIMPANAMMMIHNPAGGAVGSADDMRSTADLLDKVANGMAAAYARRSGQTIEKVLALMDAETWMTADEAVALGFATSVEQPVKIAATFDLKRYAHPPELVPTTIEGLSAAYWTRQAAIRPTGAAAPAPLARDGGLDGLATAIYAREAIKRPVVEAVFAETPQTMEELDVKSIYQRYNSSRGAE